MGTWDTGIYDNDSARDYIEGIIKNLVNVVEDMVRWDYTLLHPGMAQSNMFMCHIDMLNAICSRENLYQATRCRGNKEVESKVFGSLGVLHSRVPSNRGIQDKKNQDYKEELQ